MTPSLFLRTLAIILVIPIVLFGVAKWFEFWLSCSVGEWMAFGFGVPASIAFASLYLAGNWEKKP